MTPARAPTGDAGIGRGEDEGALAEIARRHRVCYEVWPERLLVKGKTVQVGFELQLLGVNEAHDAAQTPGCPRCAETYQDLRRIAEWLLPDPGRPTRYDVSPFDTAWHESRSRGFRPEVALRIQIGHRHGAERPVDDCELRCLAEIEEKLRRLGIGRGR